MRHFIYTKQSKPDRRYGGENYTLTVYEIVKRGELKRVGERKCCSRGHKGEDSEAWAVARDNAFTPRQMKALTKKMMANNSLLIGNYPGYYSYGMRDYGVIVEQI